MTQRRENLYRVVIVLVLPLLVLAIIAAIIVLASKPRRSARPLDLSKNGVHGIYNLRDNKGRLVLCNFRAVEPGVLYRGSGFIEYRKVKDTTGKETLRAKPAPGEVFKFLRSKGVRLVVSLLPQEEYRSELGYFNWWSKRTGYRIEVKSLPVTVRHNDSGMSFYDDRGWHGSLRAATGFIELMQTRKPQDGAVYLHCSAGKDRTGIVIAAYELWRNQGHLDKETLWRQVLDRYMVSDVLLKRAPDAVRFAGAPVACDKGSKTRQYVCEKWLEKLRPDLEFIAQL
jgi:hypothetical protein